MQPTGKLQVGKYNKYIYMTQKVRNILIFIGKHKYVLSLLVFIIIVGFLDANSFMQRIQLQQINDSLRLQIQHFEEICTRDSSRLKQLQSDPSAVVRVAREEYLMKAENEDVFIIIEEKQNNE